jgi:hypothetical protein
MPFATWWRGDPLPELPPLPGLTVRRSLNRALINQMTGLTRPAIEGRIKADNAFFVALLDREPTAYGWAALREGRIDELLFRFAVPSGNAYLWDFETLPRWRGRNIYPQLLQGITALLGGVDRFWIGYEGHNAASARGIAKAGFIVVGDLTIADGRVAGVETAGGVAVDDARLVAASEVLRPIETVAVPVTPTDGAGMPDGAAQAASVAQPPDATSSLGTDGHP